MSVEEREPDPDEIERLKREYLDAIEEEKDAASRASALADELIDRGVDPDELDTRP